MQDRINSYVHQDIQKHCDSHDQCKSMYDRTAQRILIVFSLINRKKSPRSHTESQKDRSQKSHQSISRSHRRQRIASKHTPDDQRIRNIIELLQKIAGHHRQRKQQQRAGDFPLGQVMIHFWLPHPNKFLYIIAC